MKNLIEALKELIIEAGDIALKCRKQGLKIQKKEDRSPVSNADILVNDLIVSRLTKLTPEIQIISEESPLEALRSDSFWLVDPIDGTRSYIRGESTYTINIGLISHGVPQIGLIYQPDELKLYYTDEFGDLKIEQNSCVLTLREIDKSSGYTGIVSSHYFNKFTKHFFTNNVVSEIITIPSSLKLCLISEAVADIFPKFGPTMEWDIAAGHALIIASGGDIVDINGETMKYGKPNFKNHQFYAYSRYWISAGRFL